MPYAALPDRRMPYDNDGTVVAYGTQSNSGAAVVFGLGLSVYFAQADLAELNDGDYADLPAGNAQTQIADGGGAGGGRQRPLWAFFPEQREVTAQYLGWQYDTTTPGSGVGTMQGSNDTTNGVDGTWETATYPAGGGSSGASLDGWRVYIKAISFTGGKRTIRLCLDWLVVGGFGSTTTWLKAWHLYGEKVAGQTPHDLVYIDHDTTPGAEYTAPEDFGDRPLGTSVVRQFRVKNTSATRTAANINIQCNDSDFTISTSAAGPWVVTINIASLGPGAESATMYIRNTTPAAGNLLGPRFARLVMIAEQDGVPGSNFYAP